MFTIESVTNLKWVDPEHTNFTCDVKYVEFDEVHPSGANPTDPYAHIQELWIKGIAGEFGVIAECEFLVTPSVVQKEQPVTTGAQTM
jgi:hypothetical protein